MNEKNIVREPYKGLVAFGEEDSDFFFGRKTESEIIIANLLASRLTLLYGASGVGKSSVLQAGVVHNLRQRAQKNLAKHKSPKFITVLYRSWNDDPLSTLLEEIKVSILKTCDNQSLDITYHSRNLSQVLQDWIKLVNCDLLIILDQFEDYFLYHTEIGNEDRFATELSKAINIQDLRANFLISLRDDSLAKLDHFKGRIPNLFDNYFRINHLDRKDAIEAIKGPIKQYNLLAKEGQMFDIDSKLVEVIIDQVGVGQITIDEFGGGKVDLGRMKKRNTYQIETSYLQLVMKKLWQEEVDHGSRTLSLSTLKKLGGVEGIVKKHVKDVMDTLTPQQQNIAEKAFHYLITPTGTKIAHNPKDIAASIGERLAWTDVSDLLIELSEEQKRIVRPIPPPNMEVFGIGASKELIASAESETKLYTRYEIYHDILTAAILSWRIDLKKRTDLNKQKKQAIRFGFVAAIAAFILGIILTTFSYRWNWFGARVIYLAAKNSNPMDVVDWLVDQQVIGNIVLDEISNPGTQRALVALRFAYELDPKSNKTKGYIERLLRESRIQTRPRSAPLELINNNMKILKEVYGIVPYQPILQEAENLAIRAKRMQDSTDAIVIMNRIEKQIQDIEISDTSIFNGYQVLLKKYSTHIDSFMIKKNLLALDTLILLYRNQLLMQASDTASVFRQLKSWKNFIQAHPRISPEKLYAQKEIERLEGITKTSATISSEEDIITCRAVSGLVPQGISNRFSPGNICALAKITSPKNDRIKFQWYSDGTLFYTSAWYSVPPSNGYRIHVSKSYTYNEKGMNEIRVLNSQNILIGRRVFYIN